MRAGPQSRPRRPVTRPVLALVLAATSVVLAACGGGGSATGSASDSAVRVSGTANGWVFHDGQTVTVSMGPNKLFKQYSHVNIVMCTDPGGKKSNLPTQFIYCDEDTIQGNTIAVDAGGTFSEPGYKIYKLPSSTLGESKDILPKCDATHECVLLVSEYQTDLTKPKAFSHPFTVVPSSGSQGS